ncbi:hypothetical protein DDZ14_17030 [Maritimibacter sp. 55A14]|nr:hypothetical protein DDZ14_17030 [Maritimibacter sp. 55A14]
MYAISLCSIPPRFDALAPVLTRLLAQEPAPARVLLCLPKRYHRFPGPVLPPALPEGVTLLRCAADLGPATKALPAARHLAGSGMRLIYCDDDWLVPPGWAARLLDAGRPGAAVTGSGFSVTRLKRQPAHDGRDPGRTDIAQGFSGVLVDPDWLAGPGLDPPREAWSVDDIWLSGHLARQGIPLYQTPTARDGMIPAFEGRGSLQDTVMDGRSRDAANRACAALLHRRFGIWPPLGRAPAAGDG